MPLCTPAEMQHWMQEALECAAQAEALGEVPVGAVVVLEGEIIGRGYNRTIIDHDPTAHAEVVALRAAGAAVGNYRLLNAEVFVTLEPCLMCVGAMVHARVARVVYGASDLKTGAAESCARLFEAAYLNHRVLVQGGVLADTCSERLRVFFQRRRDRSRCAISIERGNTI